ncbi:MAG: ATP-binding cassette domain-containing protein [Zetaproteobacteria bacterium]|nr:MAG: ATP-binding cassette domain-containing protein [Zetaproteobacteria bacterium]
MIQAERLTRLFGRTPAVRELSFHVHRGEVMGLLGPNGAGKSTTMKMLTCFLPPSSGQARVNGHSLDDSLAVRRSIGYLPENAPMYIDLDVQTHLRFVGRMQGLPQGTLADRIAEMARVCGLEQVLRRRIDELSKGYRQRVGLAASMLHDPACLILDEPTTGLDPNQISEIRQLIRRLGESKTVLLSSHVLAEVEAVCDRVMIIDRGQLRAIGTAEELARQAGDGQTLYVRFLDDGRSVLEMLATDGVEAEATGEVNGWWLHCPDADMPLAERTFRAAVAKDVVIVEMHARKTSLEDVFHRLTASRGSA